MFDDVDGAVLRGTQSKDSVDGIIGITQVLSPRTVGTVNFTVGNVSGYLDDPYKVAEVNGVNVPEHRPDSRDKQILYSALTRFVESANASLELSYRYYTDTFGIDAHTLGLAWYQKLGDQWILRPAVRYYAQTAADFYAVKFTGEPEFFSSDHRLSEFDAVGYGLKLIWKPNPNVALDVAVERYAQDGQDGETVQDAYVSAVVLTAPAGWGAWEAAASLPALDGYALEGSMPSLSGRVVLLDFWASWCAPCRKSFETLNALQDRYRDAGLTILAVSVDEQESAMQRFLQQHPASFAVMRDARRQLVEEAGIEAMPSSFLIDRRGRIRFLHRGYHGKKTAEEYEREIKELLAETGVSD